MRAKMAVDKYLILLCTFSYLCFVNCDLNLSEGSPCATKDLQGTCVNGTCLNIFKCDSAALSYVYANAGYNTKKYEIPDLPDICSYKDNEPVVCCPNCNIGEEKFRNMVVDPNAYLVPKEGPVARQKCLDYLQSLPFSCGIPGAFRVVKYSGPEDRNCYCFGPNTLLLYAPSERAARTE